jgi:hypothetical protein
MYRVKKTYEIISVRKKHINIAGKKGKTKLRMRINKEQNYYNDYAQKCKDWVLNKML